MSLDAIIFAVLAAVTSLAALGVALTQNMVRCAVWLLLTLMGVAGLYFYLGMAFVGAAQLIVYVGGTLVLVVFGVMLTSPNQGAQERHRRREQLLGGVICGLLGLLLIGMILQDGPLLQPVRPPEGVPETPVAELGLSLLNVEQPNPDQPLSGLPEGFPEWNRTRYGYLLPFELVSVHLLVVLIGAAYLARAKRSRQRAEGQE